MALEYIGIMIPFAGMALGGWIAYIAITSEHKQNMAMIEAGMNPKEEEAKKKHRNRLRNALLFIFVPIGIVVGQMVNDWVGMTNTNSAIVFAFLGGGIALAGAYFINQDEEEGNMSDY